MTRRRRRKPAPWPDVLRGYPLRHMGAVVAWLERGHPVILFGRTMEPQEALGRSLRSLLKGVQRNEIYQAVRVGGKERS